MAGAPHYYWKADFEEAEFEDRQRRVRVAMEAEGIDLLLVVSPININYLIGARAKSYQEFQMLFFPLEPKPPTILMRLAEVAEYSDQSLAGEVRGWGGREPADPIDAFRAIMVENGWLSRRVGLEVPDYYLHPYQYLSIRDLLGEALVMDASLLIHDLKLVKSPAELGHIRRAQTIADVGMQTCVEEMAVGNTEHAVAAAMHGKMMALGGDSPASPMNFVSGERSCYGHGAPTERKLCAGDFIHVEYGASYKRYAATIARQICLGEPTRRMREIYQVVRDACDACISEIRAGVPATRPHEAARRVIAEAGMDGYRLHTTGYGIAPGFPPSWGELVHLMPDSTYTLVAGMVISVEPPVFIHAERLGARVIDNVLVSETGAEILSSFPRDLIIL